MRTLWAAAKRSPVVVAWIAASLCPIYFAAVAESRWRRALRRLRRSSDDEAARTLARVFWIVCIIIMVKGVDNVVAAIPPLMSARPRTELRGWALAARTVTPFLFIVNNILLCVEAWFIGTRTLWVAQRPPSPAEPCPEPHPHRRREDTQEDKPHGQ